MSDLRLLSTAEQEALTTPEIVNFGPAHKRIQVEKRWQEVPLVVGVDATPLSLLAEQAALGYRLYEFMSLNRPGDLLRYLQVTFLDVPDELLKASATAILDGPSRYTTKVTPLNKGDRLAFDAFDHCLWAPESDWYDDDATEISQLWIRHRQTPHWALRLGQLLATTRTLQARLRQSPDELIGYEIALIDSDQHRRDYWASTQLRGQIDHTGPDMTPEIPRGVVELLCSLARRPDVKSISAAVKDYQLWRGLVWEQVKRSRAEGVPPKDALFLAGSDSGAGRVRAADWGGDLHIPYEGACEADVYVLPTWRVWDQVAAIEADSVLAGLLYMRHLPKVLIATRDLGQFAAEERIVCDGWFVYLAGNRGAQSGH